MSLLTDLAILVIEPDTFLALDIVQEIEALGGTAIGPVASLSEAQSAMNDHHFCAALVNADIDDQVCDLFSRLETLGLPHVAHSASGVRWCVKDGTPYFTRPIDTRLMLRSLSREVTRLGDERLQQA